MVQVLLECIYAAEKDTPMHEEEAMRMVRQFHVQMGHPSTVDLLRGLHHGGARPECFAAARKLECSVRQEHRRPKSHRYAEVAKVPRPLRGSYSI